MAFLSLLSPKFLARRLVFAVGGVFIVLAAMILSNEFLDRPDNTLGFGEGLSQSLTGRIEQAGLLPDLSGRTAELQALLDSVEPQLAVLGIEIQTPKGDHLAGIGVPEVQGDHVSMLRPLYYGGAPVGLIRITADPGKLAYNKLMHGLNDLVLIVLGIIAMTGIVVMVMRRPLKALARATDFAEELAERRGHFLDYEIDSPVEILRLQTAINHASARLADQERQLVDSQRRYQELVHIASDWVWSSDRDHKFVDLSERVEELAGVGRSDLLGKPLYEISIDGNDPEALREHKRILDAHLPFRDYVYRMRDSQGRPRTIRSSGNPAFDDRGRFLGYRGVASDISAEIEARAAVEKLERLSREAIESISEGFVLFDSDMRLIMCNETYRRAYPLIADLLQPGANFIDILRKAAMRGQFADDGEEMDTWVRERIARHLGHTDPVVCRLAGERWYVISERATPSGGVVKLLTDISEIKHQEEHLRQSHKMEALGQLASGLAHEFNNVLTAVGGFSEMGLRDPGNADRAELCFTEIAKAAERATDLTGQLLSFSRNQPTETKVLDIGQAVWDLESFLRPLLGERIALNIAPHDDGLLSVVNPSQMAQAVVNLVINARDAMPDGGSISITTDRVEITEQEAEQLAIKPGAFVAVRVTDTGLGIGDDLKKHIFEPFFTTKQAGEGTGLGLAMVYGLATGAGGTVLLDSTLGLGSTFSILLPITTKKMRAHLAAHEDLMAHARNATILIAEDDPAVLDYLKHLLFDLGYQTLAANGGVEALRLAREERPALILCDVVMGDLSGPEVVKTLKAEQPDLKAVLISGYPFPDFEGCMASAQLSKPLDPAKLAETLARLLDE